MEINDNKIENDKNEKNDEIKIEDNNIGNNKVEEETVKRRRK